MPKQVHSYCHHAMLLPFLKVLSYVQLHHMAKYLIVAKESLTLPEMPSNITIKWQYYEIYKETDRQTTIHVHRVLKRKQQKTPDNWQTNDSCRTVTKNKPGKKSIGKKSPNYATYTRIHQLLFPCINTYIFMALRPSVCLSKRHRYLFLLTYSGRQNIKIANESVTLIVV